MCELEEIRGCEREAVGAMNGMEGSHHEVMFVNVVVHLLPSINCNQWQWQWQLQYEVL